MEQSFVFERLHKPLDIHRILKMSDMEMLDRKNLIQLSKELSTSHISTTECKLSNNIQASITIMDLTDKSM